MISLFQTRLPEKSIKNVETVLREGWLSEGNIVNLFEAELQKLLNNKKVLTVNSGTSALHLALILAGVKRGLQEMWYALDKRIDEYWNSPSKYVGSQKLDVFILMLSIPKEEIMNHYGFELYTSIMIKDKNGQN